MRKNRLLILFSSILFLLVCGCGSAKAENRAPEDSDSDTDYVYSDEINASGDDETTETELTPDEEKTPDESVSDEDVPDNTDDSDDSDTSEKEGSGDFDDTPEISDDDVVAEPVFIKKPKSMNIAPRNKSVTLFCEVETGGREVKYQWYESPERSTDAGTTVEGATGTAFETPLFTEKGIRYYYCTAAVDNISLVSNVASVAYTALPALYINTPDRAGIESKEEWIKNAGISIAGATDESWNFDEVETSVKGRGNSTWTNPKKPYAIKLKQAQKVLGMPEHKRWVLLANYKDGSFMRNEVAFYLSEVFEFDWTVHGEFVDLVLNGEYRGLYWLGETIKVDGNRVNINDGNPGMTDDEDKDYLIEMDAFYDENVKFRSAVRDIPYMIQNDDFMVDENGVITNGGEARLERFQAKIENLEKLLYPDWTEGMNTDDCIAPDESYAETIDIDSWVKFWFVNEIMDNRDCVDPRSDFFTFDSTNNVFKAGPVWDFDRTLFRKPTEPQLKKMIYYNALFKSPAFRIRVKELWNEYYDRIDIEPLVESLRSELDIAALYDAMLWGYNDYVILDKSSRNFNGYADYLKERFESKLSVVDSDIGSIAASN